MYRQFTLYLFCASDFLPPHALLFTDLGIPLAGPEHFHLIDWRESGKVGPYDIEAALSRYLPEISGKKRPVSGVRFSRIACGIRDSPLTHFCG
jgi:hypothetical protein